MLNFVTLALNPTSLIAVNKDLKVPKSFETKLNAKPSLFKYPDFLKKEEEGKKGKVETAVLSTTAKVKARQNAKKGTKGDVEMSDATPSKADEKPKDEKSKDEKGAAAAKPDEKMDGAEEEKKEEGEETKEGEDKEEEKKDEPEPDFGMCKNPCRMLKQQELKMEYLKDEKYRYYPVLEGRFSGFIVLKDVPRADGATGEEEKEVFYDDEERDADAPNPDLFSDLDIPKAFEFDPIKQAAFD